MNFKMHCTVHCNSALHSALHRALQLIIFCTASCTATCVLLVQYKPPPLAIAVYPRPQRAADTYGSFVCVCSCKKRFCFLVVFCMNFTQKTTGEPPINLAHHPHTHSHTYASLKYKCDLITACNAGTCDVLANGGLVT